MKTLVIDSFGLLYKFVYSKYVSEFNIVGEDGDEQPVEYLVAFLDEILRLSKEFASNDFVFVFDSKVNIRKEMYAEYKAQRAVNDTEEVAYRKARMRKQVPLLKRILVKAGFKNIYEHFGYEGDDNIASIVFNNNEHNFVIVTSDEDILQCLHEQSSIYFFNKQELCTVEDFKCKYNQLDPSEFWKIKALAGCVSDNVAGIPRVGKKTALKYIQGDLKASTKAYKSIEDNLDIYERNTHLVKLPLKGMPEIKIKSHTPTFDEVCNALEYLELLDIMDESELNEWRRFTTRNSNLILDLLGGMNA